MSDFYGENPNDEPSIFDRINENPCLISCFIAGVFITLAVGMVLVFAKII